MQKGSRSRLTALIFPKAMISMWSTFTASAVNKDGRTRSALQPGGSQKIPRRLIQLSRKHLTTSVSFKTIESMRSVSIGTLYHIHMALITYRELLPALGPICTKVFRENAPTTNFFEDSEYKTYENMSPKIIFAHSLGGLIVKVSLSTLNPDLCSVDRCHDRYSAVSWYSHPSWQLRLNGGGSHHRKVPKIALAQWFQSEYQPEECTSPLDLKYSMNRWLEIPVRSLSEFWDPDTTRSTSKTFPYLATLILRSSNPTISSHHSRALSNSFFPSCSTSSRAIHGLGGAGKTQIVLALAHRIRQMHTGCTGFWVSATYAKKLVQIHSSKESAEKWLLIVDNVDDMRMRKDDMEVRKDENRQERDWYKTTFFGKRITQSI